MQKRPYWIRTRLPAGDSYRAVKNILRSASLHTVCEEAKCPNLWECFGQHTATFLILGNVCTRSCRFCAVTKGTPSRLDTDEPRRVALAVQKLGIKYAVITSVTRDDLPDGGAGVYAETIRLIKERVHLHNTSLSGNETLAAPPPHPSPLRGEGRVGVEVLIPDFGGSIESLKTVIAEMPDTLNHNLETVPRLYPLVRPNAIYRRSLELLKRAKEVFTTPQSPPCEGGDKGEVKSNHPIVTKSGLMLGLGEEWDEVIETMLDLRRVNCDILTLGQYLNPHPSALSLQPSAFSLPIKRYYHPEEFERLKIEGERMGFKHVESGPLVRSSYHAEKAVHQRGLPNY